MKKPHKSDDETHLKRAEEFVRRVFAKISKRPVKETTIKAVALKVSKAIPHARPAKEKPSEA